ncbi:MAG: sensor histidine kinase [Actinobacteria bacterium]|nr:sensor histidine kinase [Actinomycetota bacterium]
MRVPLAWGGAAAAAVICGASAAATYYARLGRGWREQAARAGAEAAQVSGELSQLAQEALPAVSQRVREGAPAEGVLAGLPRPNSTALRQLLDSVVAQLANAERRVSAAAGEAASIEHEVTRLVDQTFPLALRRVRAGEPADVVAADLPRPASTALQRLQDTLAREIGDSERRGAAAMGACANAAARVQAQTTRMLAELRELEQRYGNEKVFGDLMELDHRVSQLGRLADSIALLSGGRSGRRWTKPIVMESILRGAMGRVDAYRRVRVHSTSAAAISGYAAEGVMHALAELLDNAASFSAHGSEVHVYVEEEDAGVILTIEDSGLGMRKRERQRADTLVSESLDLATLPGTRLGLAVVGRLAGRYGLSVNFRPSSRGGTGVVVMIPQHLITQVRGDAEVTTPALAGEAAGAAPPETGSAADSHGLPGLPKRPPGQTLASASRTAPARAASPGPAAPEQAVARLAAFRQAGEHTRAQDDPASPGADSSE